jgi:hypothetical protein
MKTLRAIKHLSEATYLLVAFFMAILLSDLKLCEVSFRSFTTQYRTALSQRSFSVVGGASHYTDLQNTSHANSNNFLKPLLKDAFPDIKVPVLTNQEFRSINWSNQTRSIKRKNGKSIYHDYTIVCDPSNGSYFSLFPPSFQVLSYE